MAISKEQLYDTQIGPMLIMLANKCQEAGLSFHAVVEMEPGNCGSTSTLQAGAGAGIRHAVMAARAGSNVDSLIMGLMKEAQAVGHSSACLKQLGVPEVPAK